jgi:hypothetical protein
MTARRNENLQPALQRKQDREVRSRHLQDFRAPVAMPLGVNFGLGEVFWITPTGTLFTVPNRAFAAKACADHRSTACRLASAGRQLRNLHLQRSGTSE